MGCCFSRPSGPNSPYPGGGGASSRAINAPDPPPLTLPPAAADRRHHRRPLDQHINKPLRRHHWVAGGEGTAQRRHNDGTTTTTTTRTWTRRALDAEREAFFDTQVSGRPEVWQGLRAALEVLWEADRGRGGAGGGGLDGADDDGGEEDVALATAQSILDAVEVTLPTGDLVDGAYDALGNYYQLVECVVCDPVDVAEEEDGGDDGKMEVGESGEIVDGVEDGDEAQRRRDEKGKSVVDRRAMVAVFVRLSDTGRDFKIKVGKEERVGSVVRRLREETGHSPTCRIRLVHFGKMLRENASLIAQGWEKGQVISAFVYEVPEVRPAT